MLIPNQIIETQWSPAAKKWYENKGYEFTGYGKILYVKPEDLPPNSRKLVKVKCEYCGEVIEKQWVYFLRGRTTGKDCCPKCNQIKIKDSFLARYGVDNPFYLDKVKDKIKVTNLEKYGAENPFASEIIQNKIKTTNLEKYGVEHIMQSEEYKEKYRQFCLERYGVENAFQSEEIKEKIRQTNLEKYGVDCNIAHVPEIQEKIQQTNLKKYGVRYATQAPEVIKKIRKALYKNGTIPTSSMEKYVCDLVHEIYGKENCKDGFAVGLVNLDCLLLFNDKRIDIEYDGWYWHKNRQEQDKRRNYWLIRQGYKVLRIRSNYELPTKEQIIEGVDYLVKGNHSLKFIDLDINI